MSILRLFCRYTYMYIHFTPYSRRRHKPHSSSCCNDPDTNLLPHLFPGLPLLSEYEEHHGNSDFRGRRFKDRGGTAAEPWFSFFHQRIRHFTDTLFSGVFAYSSNRKFYLSFLMTWPSSTSSTRINGV